MRSFWPIKMSGSGSLGWCEPNTEYSHKKNLSNLIPNAHLWCYVVRIRKTLFIIHIWHFYTLVVRIFWKLFLAVIFSGGFDLKQKIFFKRIYIVVTHYKKRYTYFDGDSAKKNTWRCQDSNPQPSNPDSSSLCCHSLRYLSCSAMMI